MKRISVLFAMLAVMLTGSSAYVSETVNENTTSIIQEADDDNNFFAAIRRIVDFASESILEYSDNRVPAQEETEVETEEMVEETETEVETEEETVEETTEASKEESKPVENKPAQTTPVESKPVQTIPAETKPVETQPVQTTPAETKPVETKPVETQPVQTQPAQTAPQTQAPAPQAPAVGGLTAAQQNALNAHLVAAINAVRASAGLPGLNLEGGLVSISAVRANEASVMWSHTRPDGTRGIDMISADKWRGENLSKIVLGGFDGSDAQLAAIAQRIVNNWVGSAGHYANLVGANFTNIGLYTYTVNNGNSIGFYTAAMFSN